jgi:hypothetical protein
MFFQMRLKLKIRYILTNSNILIVKQRKIPKSELKNQFRQCLTGQIFRLNRRRDSVKCAEPGRQLKTAVKVESEFVISGL